METIGMDVTSPHERPARSFANPPAVGPRAVARCRQQPADLGVAGHEVAYFTLSIAVPQLRR
jgi:hypothetical protein